MSAGEVAHDRETVKTACREAAWPEPTYTCGHHDCPHDEHRGEPNLLVHCRSGGFGADWPLEGVLTLVDESDDVRWGNGFDGHDLAVKDGDRWRVFDVPRPKPAEAVSS